MEEERKVYKVCVVRPKGKRPLRRPWQRWENWIKMDLGEIGLESVEWIHLAQDRDWWRALLNTAMNSHVLAPQS
jgi:hypothetical protein